MQIGEVAKLTAIGVHAIRFWEIRKLLPGAGRSAGRFRLYTQDAIECLRCMQQMQRLGFSLGELIELRSRTVEACEAVERLAQSVTV